MGVQHLWGILDPVQQIVPLETLSPVHLVDEADICRYIHTVPSSSASCVSTVVLRGKHLCIDLSFWLCELNLPNVHSNQKSYLRGLFHRLRALLALDCRLTFVADGAVPAIKLPAYYQRLEGCSLPLQPVPIRENASSGRRYKTSEFGRMVEEAKALARAMGVAVITSVEEAEAQCALLNSAGIADICCTGDSDAFLFGAAVVMRRMDLHPARSTATLYRAAHIRSLLGFGRASLIALGLLLGSDYSPKLKGIGKEKAVKVVKAAGDEGVLDQVVAGGVRQLARKGKPGATSKQQEREKDEEKLAKQCLAAYLHPNCHPASAPLVTRALSAAGTVHLPDLVALLGEQLGWEAEQTEGYILPKLAERDLRRAARGCLGGYAVMRVLKARVRYGRDFYEVQWTGGAPPSVVPAHLVRTAFPSEVAAFLETKGRKGRVEKGEGDICQRLERLQLDRQPRAAVEQREEKGDSSPVQRQGGTAGKHDVERGWAGSKGGIPFVDLGSPSPPLPPEGGGEEKSGLLSGVSDSESDVECVDATSFLEARARRRMGQGDD